MRVLTVNPGSSSLKLSVLDPDDSVVWRADLATSATGREVELLGQAVTRMPRPDAVGLRFVHGGRDFTTPVPIDDDVVKHLHALADLAPLHQPLSLHALGEIGEVLPGVPAVACFDTAFHAAMPEAATTYALPAEWRERYGLRRYGFHGLSHAYSTRRATELLSASPPDPPGPSAPANLSDPSARLSELRLVICHLGSGASLAAVANGRSVDTTMGFTPLEGLVMATRAGSIDPGIPLWLIKHGHSPEEINNALERESGLRGLSGTPDIRELRRRDDETARAALDVYHHRLRACAAAMTAALGGLDVLVFTGGIGEHDPATRHRLARDLSYLGAAVDPDRNSAARGDAEITAAGAPVRTLVIAAREDLEIAAGVRKALSTT